MCLGRWSPAAPVKFDFAFGRGSGRCWRIKQSCDSASIRSEEHTSELQSLMRIPYAVFCLKKKKNTTLNGKKSTITFNAVSYTHIRANETTQDHVGRHNIKQIK